MSTTCSYIMRVWYLACDCIISICMALWYYFQSFHFVFILLQEIKSYILTLINWHSNIIDYKNIYKNIFFWKQDAKFARIVFDNILILKLTYVTRQSFNSWEFDKMHRYHFVISFNSKSYWNISLIITIIHPGIYLKFMKCKNCIRWFADVGPKCNHPKRWRKISTRNLSSNRANKNTSKQLINFQTFWMTSPENAAKTNKKLAFEQLI